MSSAANVSWDLTDLYAAVDDPRIDKDLDAAHERARAFETAYRGKVGGDAASLLKAVVEYEGLCEQMDRSAAFAGLIGLAVAARRFRRPAVSR